MKSAHDYTYRVDATTATNAARQLLLKNKKLLVVYGILLVVELANLLVQIRAGMSVDLILALFLLVVVCLVPLKIYTKIRRQMAQLFGAVGSQWHYSFAADSLRLKSDLYDNKVKYEVFDRLYVGRDFVFLRYAHAHRLHTILPLPPNPKTTAFLASKIAR